MPTWLKIQRANSAYSLQLLLHVSTHIQNM